MLGGETASLSNSCSVFRVDLVEELNLLLNDVSSALRERSNDVVDEVGSLLVIENFSEENCWLLEVSVGMSVLISAGLSTELSLVLLESLILDRSVEGVGLVVDTASLVSMNSGWSVSLVVGNSGSVWAVNGDLIIIGAKSMSVGIGV